MKKLSTLLIALTLVFSVFSHVVFAEDEAIDIITPQDGATVDCELDQICVNVNVPADYTVIYLDGTEIAKTQDYPSVLAKLSAPLTIGIHKLEVVVVGESGAYSKLSTFYAKQSKSAVVHSEDMSTAPNLNKFYSEKPVLGVDEQGSEKRVEWVRIDGYGSDNPALGIKFPIERSSAVPGVKPYIALNDFASLTGKGTIEMDLFMEAPMAFQFECKSALGWSSLFASGLNDIFLANGTVAGSGGYTYPIGEWFKIKMDIDFATGIGTLYVGIYQDDGTIVYEPVLENYENNPNVKGIFQIKLQLRVYECAKDRIFGIDNFKISETKYIGGFDSISYEASGGYVESDDGTVPAGTSKIKLSPASQFASVDSLAGSVTALADGHTISVTNAAIAGDALTLQFAEPLRSQSCISLLLPAGLTLASGGTAQYPLSYLFYTQNDDFCIESVEYIVQGYDAYTAYQIEAGDTLDAKVSFVNNTCQDQNIYVAAALFESDRLVALTYKKVVAPAGETMSETLLLNVPEKNSTYNVEVFAFDGFINRIPISKVWTLK